MVLSSETADHFFGEEDPIGKFIQVDSIGAFEVKGIVAGVYIVVMVGLLTISSQTLKAARTQPASTLIDE
jgi:hypothetical protein